MASSSKLLYGAIALLMVDSIMELAFISSMVAWLHARAGKGFILDGPNGTFNIRGKPEHFLLNQGHASNGASGTAFIAIGMGGILVLWLRHRQLKHHGSLQGFVHFIYNFWLTLTVLSAIFSLASWIYVMTVTYGHNNQTINVQLVEQLNGKSPYPSQQWTPQGWFTAMLNQFDFASSHTRSDVESHLRVMRGWEWNLIPMMILGFVVMVLAFLDRRRQGQSASRAGNKLGDRAEDIPLSP